MRGLMFLLLLWPVAAVAQNVTVRSGEHASFSRLVFAIGPSTRWFVERTPNGATLVLPDRSVVFKIEEVFARIPRDRLQDVVQESGDRLSLVFECECYVNAFLWQPGQLVVDVLDGPDPSGQSETSRPIVRTDLPNLLAWESLEGAVTRIDTDVFERSVERSQSVDLQATEAALTDGLARAASQGFLDLATTAQPTTGGEATLTPLAETSSPPIALRPSPHPGISVTTAFEQDFSGLASLLSNMSNQTCLSPDLFEVREWASGGVLSEEVRHAMLALDGDFGQMPANAIEELAKVYLYFGFGAEARMVLMMDSASSQQRQILTELSHIIDGSSISSTLLQTQRQCMTAASLWAFVAKPEPIDQTLRNQILQDFFSLPQPLRMQMAPRLANGFLLSEEVDAADKILRAADGSDVALSHEVLSAQATLAEESGAPDIALALLEQQAGDNARTTPTSVIRLINLALEQGQIPSEADLVLAAALRQQFRNDPVAQDLAVAEALGHLANSDYETALKLLAGRTDTGANEALNDIYTHITDTADNNAFLEISFALLPEGLNGETRNRLARRVLDLGFAPRTKEILAQPAIREAAAERRYLLAEAALRLGQTAEVLELLQGLNEDRARALKADAYTAAGDFEAALSAASPTDRPADPVQEFRAGAWERLAVQPDPAFSGFAGTVLERPVSDAIDTLANRRLVLDQSRQTRKSVEDLLLRFGVEHLSE